jgi:cyclopropane fatty-acyl-phospholipid synthase-like methyltransferase
MQVPTYEEVIRQVGIAPAQRVLDIGCGTGVFLRLVADRGATPFGLDASEALLEIARERVPEADLPSSRFVAARGDGGAREAVHMQAVS